MTTSKRELVDTALTYAERGIPTFPVHIYSAPTEKEPGKVAKTPLTARGFLDATTSFSAVESWETLDRFNGLGMPTGHASGIFVLDIDVATGGYESLATLEAEHGQLPNTRVVITGSGGKHYWFKMPEDDLRNTVGKLGPGIDTRANGGVAIIPPSNYPGGRTYEFELDIEEGDQTPLADMPEWMKTKFLEAARAPAGKLDEVIPIGKRDDQLFSLAGSMRRRGATEESIYAALTAQNANCEVPLDDKDIKRLARSGAKYKPEASVAADASEKKKGKPKRTLFKWIDEPALRTKEFPPTKWYAKNFLHQGTAILGGRPKQGKSWLALNIAINLATGTDVMGHYAVEEPHKVVFFTLEDSERLIRERIIKLATDPVPNLRVVTQTARIDDGFLDDMNELIDAGYRVFVIDVLAKIEPSTSKSSEGYRDTYERLDPVKDLCETHDAVIIMITHTRKMQTDNREENIMGSTAYTANPDMVWVLERGDGTANLDMKSKEMEPKIVELQPRFDGTNWEVLSEGSDQSTSAKDKEVVTLMKEDYSEITPNQLARETGWSVSAATKRLRRMHDQGLIRKVKRGLYGLNNGTFETPPPYSDTGR